MTGRVPLTWLYVPADRPDRVVKALASDADVVVLDLEDAVLPARKATARDVVAEVGGRPAREAAPGLQVRVNAVGTPWCDDDLDLVAGLPGAVGLRLPVCERPEDVRAVANRVGDRPLHLLLESAVGLEAASELARSAPSVATIGLGEADLRADLGVVHDDGLLYARGRVVAAAAAAGLPPPAMSVFTDVRDLGGLAASCAVGRRLGFLGRAVIHPRQLPAVVAAFTPTASELAAAQEVLAAAADAARTGVGALALADGRFVDEAVVRRARRVVSLSEGRR